MPDDPKVCTFQPEPQYARRLSFPLMMWCCAEDVDFFFGRPLERIRALVEGAKSLLLEPSGTEGTFRTLFLCVHSPALPLGVAPDPASLGQGEKEPSI